MNADEKKAGWRHYRGFGFLSALTPSRSGAKKSIRRIRRENDEASTTRPCRGPSVGPLRRRAALLPGAGSAPSTPVDEDRFVSVSARHRRPVRRRLRWLLNRDMRRHRTHPYLGLVENHLHT